MAKAGEKLRQMSSKRQLGTEKKYGQARRVWVFDRGVVSEKNLQLVASARGVLFDGAALPLKSEDIFERTLNAYETWLIGRGQSGRIEQGYVIP